LQPTVQEATLVYIYIYLYDTCNTVLDVQYV
jgi:hypothetical protein